MKTVILMLSIQYYVNMYNSHVSGSLYYGKWMEPALINRKTGIIEILYNQLPYKCRICIIRLGVRSLTDTLPLNLVKGFSVNGSLFVSVNNLK